MPTPDTQAPSFGFLPLASLGLFPIDIARITVEHAARLDFTTGKNLRGTSSILNEWATPVLFRHIRFKRAMLMDSSWVGYRARFQKSDFEAAMGLFPNVDTLSITDIEVALDNTPSLITLPSSVTTLHTIFSKESMASIISNTHQITHLIVGGISQKQLSSRAKFANLTHALVTGRATHANTLIRRSAADMILKLANNASGVLGSCPASLQILIMMEQNIDFPPLGDMVPSVTDFIFGRQDPRVLLGVRSFSIHDTDWALRSGIDSAILSWPASRGDGRFLMTWSEIWEEAEMIIARRYNALPPIREA
ncbi:hypothetical protein DL96DRAFT_625480 [Flagelloscypha sp. PMI_526]|nr:hypothetical protein DL96DRAFT_625480 [Flagelloscypha sp. PMI_526]